MHPQLQAVVDAFDAAQGRLHRLADALPEERWSARPDPRRWSVAECVAHLNLTSRAYLPLLRDAIERARALGVPAPRRYRRDLAGWVLAYAAGPLPRIAGRRIGRVKTAAAFVPSAAADRETLIDEFDALQEEQAALARTADGLPIDRVRIVSPFGPLRYDAFSALVVLPRHQVRHVEQAEDVWRGR